MMNALRSMPSPWNRIPDFIQLMRLDKPIGIYLLLWPALWAVWIASNGHPSLKHLFIFAAGVVLTRSGGCVINDFADRDFDGHVERTQNRPLATGRISSKEALALAATIGLLSFVLVLFTNLFTIALSVGALLLACTYPFMKRYTHLPQVVLGSAFAWSIPMAFAAIREQVPLEAWLLYAATLLWTVAYDTLYAMVDREDDLKIGVKSTAILFGRFDLLAVALLEGATLCLLVMIGDRLHLGIMFNSALIISTLLWAHQLWSCRTRDRNACFAAFLNNHWVGAVLFAGIVADYALVGATIG